MSKNNDFFQDVRFFGQLQENLMSNLSDKTGSICILHYRCELIGLHMLLNLSRNDFRTVFTLVFGERNVSSPVNLT